MFSDCIEDRIYEEWNSNLKTMWKSSHVIDLTWSDLLWLCDPTASSKSTTCLVPTISSYLLVSWLFIKLRLSSAYSLLIHHEARPVSAHLYCARYCARQSPAPLDTPSTRQTHSCWHLMILLAFWWNVPMRQWPLSWRMVRTPRAIPANRNLASPEYANPRNRRKNCVL